MSVVETPTRVTPRPAPAEQAAPKVIPVQWWAFIGALICAFWAYVLIRWVTGPYFQHVPTGPTPLPEWMKVSLIGWQIVMPAIWLSMGYWFVVRPWRREHRLTVDGLIFLAGTTLVMQDGLSNYFNPWITYNAYFVNAGSWYNDVPGWMAYGEPGHMVVEPPLFIPFVYGFFFLLTARVGSAVMKRSRARWPMLPYSGMLAIVFTTMFVLDIVVEGFIWMPFGTFTYVGGHMPALFPDAYHRFPLQEAIFAGFLTTTVAVLYHFRNDRGETWVERGIDEVRGSHLKKTGLRLLAMIGAMQVIFFLTYNVPMTAFFGSKAAEWPKDAQERSYLTDGMCGAGTTMACPSPGVPLNRGNARNQTGIRIGPNGERVVPPGTELPREVPFSTESKDAFNGSVVGF
jgi:hypothetical protein